MAGVQPLSDSHPDTTAENWLFSRLPTPVIGSLTQEQREALRQEPSTATR